MNMETERFGNMQPGETPLESSVILRSFYDNSPVLMGVAEPLENDILHIYDNPATCSFFGVPPESTKGKLASQLGAPQEIIDLWLGKYQECRRTERPVAFQYRHPASAGGIWLSVTISPLSLDGRSSFSYVAINIDEHIRTEEALRESEEHFRTLADNISQLAWMADGKGSVFWCNKRWHDYTGTTLVEMQETGGWRLAHPEHRDRVRETLLRSFETGAEWDDTFPLRGRDGSYRWFLSRAVPIRDEKGSLYRWIGTNTDITPQIQAEQSLRDMNRRLRLLSHLAERLLDADAPVDAATSAFETIAKEFGLEAYFNFLVEPNGKLRLDSWSGIPAHAAHLVSRLDPGEAVCGLVAMTREPAHVEEIQHSTEHRVELIRRQGLRAYYCSPLIAKGGLLGTLSFGTRSRDRFTDEELGLMDTVVRYVALADERLRSERELREAEQALKAALKDLERSNQDLQQFAYAASHDLQEPLRMVTSYLQLLERRYKGQLDQKARNYITYAVDGATRMQRLIEGLLNYSRITRGAEFEAVDANAALAAALENLVVAVRESGAEITSDPLPTVEGDEMQLIQLFQNLIGNALKYRKPEVQPRVHVSAAAGKGEWGFSVQDNGIGIAPEHFDRIFQVFQRLHTRDEYPGTGIGLAAAKKIVERHHGRIWVESEPGKGSTFFFTLPAER